MSPHAGSTVSDQETPDTHRSAHEEESATVEVSPALRSTSGQFLKRTLDLMIAIPVVTVILPPLCVLVRIVQLLQSPGPLFFCQRRSGRDDVEFTIFKFRTMNVSETESDCDTRIYPLGALLRRSKLDELPQFVNVLLGSMSVVGPRPHHFADCKTFSQRVAKYSFRSAAKPGITGMAQYHEYRGDFEWNCLQSRVSKDLEYIQNWSLLLDIRLILSTAGIVLQRIIGGVLRRLGLVSRPPAADSAALKVFSPTDVDDQDKTSDPTDIPAQDRKAA